MIHRLLHAAIESGIFSSRSHLSAFQARLEPFDGILEQSLVVSDTGLFLYSEHGGVPALVVLTEFERTLDGYRGEHVSEYEAGVTYYAMKCPLAHENAVSLRRNAPSTAPSVLYGPRSFGFGDRIGRPAAATPWHIEAVRGKAIAPVLAQQSVRENSKTGRTFETVLDDVTWSVLRCGYEDDWGADADHLKTLDDIERAVNAGFTMFTLDPSDLIDHGADTDPAETLAVKLARHFAGERDMESFISRYERTHKASRLDITRSAVKYLAATQHAIEAYRRIAELKAGLSFNFEMSIDETTTPTSLLDHRIIATELLDADVNLYSLAPRFVGSFEKGVDYRGNVGEFTRTLGEHVALSRTLGEYRLSLHSGSDKFKVYPIFGELTDGFFHVKTAGTSYLEAVKAVALTDYTLFGRIYGLSRETFEKNAASYEISADISRVPLLNEVDESTIRELIATNDDVRQMLHIAFGVVLDEYGREFMSVLSSHAETYKNTVVSHIEKHLDLLL